MRLETFAANILNIELYLLQQQTNYCLQSENSSQIKLHEKMDLIHFDSKCPKFYVTLLKERFIF